MENLNKPSSNRIHSLDAIRAFTLVGILLIHTSQLFNYNNSHNNISFMGIEHNSSYIFIAKFLTDRFRLIFSLLFGVSFYLLLKNPQYPKTKFIWRCVVLIFIGIANKIFYTTDILMLYGVCGIIMVPISALRTKYILSIALLLKSWGYFINILDVLEIRDYTIRYIEGGNVVDIMTYPLSSAIFDYFTMIFPFGISDTLAWFLLGYSIARSGFIYKFDEITFHHYKGEYFVAIIMILGVLYHSTYIPIIRECFYSFSAIVYIFLYVCVYNYTRRYLKKIIVLEKMGRLGLTNYTIMNILGVVFVTSFVFRYQFTFNQVLCFSLIMIVFLLIFSNIWLRYHKNGPLETVWRALTDLCFQQK